MKRKLSHKPVVTLDMCYAAGQDAGNRSMKKAGRTKWSIEDFNVAANVCNTLLDLKDAELGLKSASCKRVKRIGGNA